MTSTRRPAGAREPRVGLVLGAGGVLGGAWHVGALHALATELGWDPGSADVIVGTSAGAVVGALHGAGVPPWFMLAHSAGERFAGLLDARGEPTEHADRSGGAVFRRAGLPLLLPGSPSMVLRGVRELRGRPVLCTVAGLAPRGVVSTQPLADTVRRAIPSGWAPHPALWIVATDYRTGRRVVFGREGAPRADLADAAAASAAIPGFYRPVRIAGREYVDGGVWSYTNLDLLADRDLDVVVCLSPASCSGPLPRRFGLRGVDAAMRRGIARQVRAEAEALRARGVEVVVLEPSPDDVDLIGPNPMSARRRNEVIDAAVEGVTAALRALPAGSAMRRLPAGEPFRIRRPRGPASRWPAVSGVARERHGRGRSPAA